MIKLLLTLCMLGNFAYFLGRLQVFFKIFLKHYFENTGPCSAVTCLTADTCLIIQGRSLISAGFHTFMEVDREIISTAIHCALF